MKSNLGPGWLVLLAIFALVRPTFAAVPALKVGDSAPQLENGRWIQGEPVKSFEAGKVYLIAFWATWSEPCRGAIRLLSDLDGKFKKQGLTIIGQDCWEADEQLVEPYVKAMGGKMSFPVALDEKASTNNRGTMARTWLVAAGRTVIPSAFLVDGEGKVAWIGHPMELKESVITAVLAGKHDLPKASTEYALQLKNEVEMRVVWRDLALAMQRKNWEEASARLADAERMLPADQRDLLDPALLEVLLAQDDAGAYQKLAARLSETHLSDASLQNRLAWEIATHEGFKQRDLELAYRIAVRADEASGGKDPAIIDTVARVQFMRGKKAEAIALEEKALKLASGRLKAEFQKVLNSYRKGQLPEVE